jgi:hypothetical protein
MSESGWKAEIAGVGPQPYRSTMKPPFKMVMACIATVACVIGATTFAAAKRDRSASLSMKIHFVPPAVCEVSFAGQTFSLPGDQDGMVTALQELRREWRSVSMSGGMETPYRCIGHVVYLAQRGGFKKVGFVAQPSER